MNKVVVNTFTGGMQKDLDKSLVKPNQYIDAQNYRLITTEGNTTGSLENVKGTKFILDIVASGSIAAGYSYLVVKDDIVYNSATRTVGTTFTGVGGVTTYTGSGNVVLNNFVSGYIIGSCQLRDDIILFTTDNTDTSPTARGNRIYKLVVDLTTESQSSLTLLYDDTYNTDDSSLEFSTAYPIKAVGKYETPNVQKVYWTDGYNPIRYCNVAAELTVDGEAYASDGDYMSVDKFEFLPKITVTKPTLKNVVGGRVKTGLIAYAYQMYITNGAETAISPLSDPIHVVVDNDFVGTTLSYNGESESVISGKGFTMQIVNTDIGYNRLRLIRVHYEYINSVPQIFVVNDIAIPTTAATIQVTDVGDDLYELTLDEFTLSSTELFTCGDIAAKDNRLFASNITKLDFETDTWDARAVRFKAAGFATVYDSSDNYGAAAAVTITPPTFDTTVEWDAHGWSGYLTEHDGVNKFNDPDNDGDSAYQWMYQSDGTTLGAEGKNIKIDFETETIVLDSSNSSTSFYSVAPTDATDLSYKNYASIWKGGKLSWQRDEVYRLFVVFGNNRGQVADPKWICDLRMPSLHDNGYHVLGLINGTTIETTRLYPRVWFKSFPTNATWAQIYRVKRARQDRFVVTQGLAIGTSNSGSDYFPNRVHNVLFTNKLFKLVSPEININKNISKEANDYIQYTTTFTGATVTNDTTDGYNRKTVKCKTNTRAAFSSTFKADVVDAFPIAPNTSSSDYVTINSLKYSNYTTDSSDSAKGSTGLLVAHDDSDFVTATSTVDYPIVNYKSNIYGSQYGGMTYEDRMANISIPCSDVILSTGTGAYVDIAYGDTFINYFDVSTHLYDLSLAAIGDSFSDSIFVPLESSVNCDLRHDTSCAHLTYSNTYSNLRQEYQGTHTMGIGAGEKSYDQELNLYLYNTVYSQQVDVKALTSLVVDKILETEFDSMVKVSNLKSNGEVTDSWTKFGVNEFIEVDSIYGPVNAINTFNGRLFYFQDKAFGLLSVNDRSIVQDSNSSQIVLGTGGVLDRFDYISTIIGCKDMFSLANGATGLFWYDRVNNFIIKYSDQIDKISMSKGIQSYLNANVLTTQSVIAHPDINNSEILFTFFIGGTGSDDDSFTIAYSENFEAFISFYSFIPNIYIPFDNRYLTTTRSKYCGSAFNLNYLFIHDSNLYPRCNFYSTYPYNTNTYYDSTIKLIYNSDYNYAKVFDDLIFNCNVYYNNIDLYDQSINQIRCYNDFQNTDYVTLTYKTNLERRERGWTTVVPRNLVDADLTTNPDIFAAGNLTNTTRTFRERLRDKYMILDAVYENTVSKDKIVLNNLACKHRVSYR